jgi:hypothetical protein
VTLNKAIICHYDSSYEHIWMNLRYKIILNKIPLNFSKLCSFVCIYKLSNIIAQVWIWILVVRYIYHEHVHGNSSLNSPLIIFLAWSNLFIISLMFLCFQKCCTVLFWCVLFISTIRHVKTLLKLLPLSSVFSLFHSANGVGNTFSLFFHGFAWLNMQENNYTIV